MKQSLGPVGCPINALAHINVYFLLGVTENLATRKSTKTSWKFCGFSENCNPIFKDKTNLSLVYHIFGKITFRKYCLESGFTNYILVQSHLSHWWYTGEIKTAEENIMFFATWLLCFISIENGMLFALSDKLALWPTFKEHTWVSSRKFRLD